MSLLPWPHVVLTASHIGLMPAQFWALSVKEWRALMGDGQGLDKARLDALCRDFPDNPASNQSRT